LIEFKNQGKEKKGNRKVKKEFSVNIKIGAPTLSKS